MGAGLVDGDGPLFTEGALNGGSVEKDRAELLKMFHDSC